MSVSINPLGLQNTNFIGGSASSGPRAKASEGASDAVQTPIISDTTESWRNARESVRSGQAALTLSAAAGRQAASYLDSIATAAREGRSDDVAALDEQLRAHVTSSIEAGASLLAGGSLKVDLGGEGATFSVDGSDLRFPAQPRQGLDSPGAAEAIGSAAEVAAKEIRTTATRWDEAAQRVSAHEGVLAAASRLGAGATQDLNADGARLMALQVRQSLGDGGIAIANADPKAILALFKS
jgi:hypothetical protein